MRERRGRSSLSGKTSPRAWTRSEAQGVGRGGVEVWFGDEARIGQESRITRRRARRGTRPSAPQDLRTASTDVFGAQGCKNPTHPQDAKHQALHDFLRALGSPFEGVAAFDRATLDPATGELRAAFVPESTTADPGKRLHPDRAGYEAMAAAIDLALLLAPAR